MTRNKDLKKQIRARMAKTGERYTTARAHVVGAPEPSSGLGGVHGETAALRGLLVRAGVNRPDTGKPFSEALLLGIGGGLGAAYFVFEYAGADPTLYIGTRVGHQYPYTADFSRSVLERLGLDPRMAETGGKKAAAKNLDEALADGGATIAWVDKASLPHWQMAEAYKGAMPHVVLVDSLGAQAGSATIYDHADAPFTISLDALADARARLRKAKNRVLWVDDGASCGDLAAAVEAGLRTCVSSLRDGALVKGFGSNFGLDALAKWADLIGNRRNKKGWPKVFNRGRALFVGLREAYFWLEVAAGTGGGFRAMFADFLDEAAVITKQNELGELARDYRELAELWTGLANAMLPADVAVFAETRELVRGKRAALRKLGPGATEAVAQANARLEAIADGMNDSFPLDQEQTDALYVDLQQRVRDIHEREVAAVDRLEAMI